MIQLGQYPAPSHVIAHVSDTHLLADGRKLYGVVENEANLRQAMKQLEALQQRPQAIVFTGDLADLGEVDAYVRLRSIVEPAAERMGAKVIWVMGNHDIRENYATELFDAVPSLAPQDAVYDIDGLRIISFDTTVPGYHHGAITDAQLDWLADVLSEKAEHGTLLAVHHPPMPTPLLWAMDILELHGQDRLKEVLTGTDVRGILAGHLHYSSHSTFAGIPVSVAAATCYTLDLTAPQRLLAGVNANQAINLVHAYPGSLVHSIVPLGDEPEISGFPLDQAPRIEAMSFDERIEVFSKKNSAFNKGEVS